MQVLLINPPSENEIIGNNPEIIEEERGNNPPLGLLYIAGYLEVNSDYTVRVLDCQVEELTYPQIETRLSQMDFDVVGMTAMSFTLLDVMKTIHIVKQINPNACIVLGGPHPHLFPNETLALDGVDFVILGEGEKTFLELLHNLEKPDELFKIPGIVFRSGNQIINTGNPPFIEDLDALPFPARHLTPYQKYDSLLAKRTPVTIMMTSRGCPYQCAFCDRPQLGKRFRARSTLNVVDEIEACIKMGIHEFIMYDDTFTVKKDRAKGICDEIVRRKLDIGWDIRARVDTIDEELLIKLKQAGCRGIHYGVEAGTEKILKVLNKGITLDCVEEVFRMTRKHGLMTLAYFMIGSPGETREDILQTFAFSRKLDADFVHMTILTPFPGTKIYFDGMSSGIIDRDYWREFAENPTHDFIPPHWNENFTLDELRELLVYGYKQFYTRPGYILKRLVKVESFGELKRKVKAGIKVIFMK
ncbi:cobalamin B12-binding domain-containing protein [candidate division KSB1 bacterium]|nr:cobalamin B12-binding domain-containing protein [candidate division KSB1 bacterium]